MILILIHTSKELKLNSLMFQNFSLSNVHQNRDRFIDKNVIFAKICHELFQCKAENKIGCQLITLSTDSEGKINFQYRSICEIA